MAKVDPAILDHEEWLAYVQQTGLVVAAPALARAGAYLNRHDAEGQGLLQACVDDLVLDPGGQPEPCIHDFPRFARTVLGWSWSGKWYAGGPDNPVPPEVEVALPGYGETLRPEFAVREPDPAEGRSPWQLLVQVLEPGEDFDRVVCGKGGLEASGHGRMERLLRGTGVLAGVLSNGRALRLISAPPGETSGWLDFRVGEMLQTSGRPIAAAMRLLLGQMRLVGLPRGERLAALLDDSRKFQNEVSETLAQQVLHALYELLRGFQAAHDVSGGPVLGQALAELPDEVYRALLTVVLRLVFLLYAEERGMLPADETFGRHYSLASLYQRLREDAALYPDTMGQRYGAWAQLLVLFRLIHDGARRGAMRLPPRHGVLFDPDRYPFLEGRPLGASRQRHERIQPPLVPDATVYRALEKLLVLGGSRISYRALDVEHVGSVYETMMGFRLELATGRSVAIRASKKGGAPAAIDLDALLAAPAATREKALLERTGRKLTDRVKKAVKEAREFEDLHAALAGVIDTDATPDLVPAGAMVLQPSEERRRSGSHYTPRSLTEPIVRKTLEPVLARLRGADGRPPMPEAILDLKVCDPAMGSGAFLVEACRQLGDALIEAWHAHDAVPPIPPDEDEIVFARRLVAQRCLYGVDRNPVAVDLAKVSLGLVTLASDHAFTFLDHAFCHGDSLVGLTRRQIEAFHWDDSARGVTRGVEAARVREQVSRAAGLRRQIQAAGDSVSDRELRDLLDQTQHELARTRPFGDLVVAAFFEGKNARERERLRVGYATEVAGGEAQAHRGRLDEWRHGDKPLVPFHWEIEFPEVFARDNPGFDAIVGNPPFAGKNTMANANADGYPDWLKVVHPESHGNSDLVAHFFRLAFDLVREGGAFGLIATNTIGQGDTRSTGLRWICTHGGEIYVARKRVKWPGLAAVVVSVVHVHKGRFGSRRELDGRPVEMVTAFLFHRGGHEDPAKLAANAGKAFQGSIVLGMGFTFDDTDTSGVATSIAEMHRLIEKDPRNAERIFPYIGGQEINASPTHQHHRYIINLSDLRDFELSAWPDLTAIVEAKIKGKRAAHSTAEWWQFERARAELYARLRGIPRAIALSRVTEHLAPTFVEAGSVFTDSVVMVASIASAAFGVMQSRPHEAWARFSSSSLGEGLRYSVEDCFETFPFPEDWESHPALEAAGKENYEFRAALMVRNNEGLTKIYNRFHDPDERDPDILELRELHTAMDRAVLDAYGWTDIPTGCEFLLDYEIDEEDWGDKKKPFRYRWPDDVRDDVLARLLELNAERARQEQISGAAAEKKPGRKRASKTVPAESKTASLFPPD